MYFDGYIYPYFFNDFDVVIISSSNLSRDLSNKVIFVSIWFNYVYVL